MHGQRISPHTFTINSRARERAHVPPVGLSCSAGLASLTLCCLELREPFHLQALLAGLLPPAAHLHRLALETAGLSAHSFSGCSKLLSSVAEVELDGALESGESNLTEILTALLQHTPQPRRLELIGIGPEEIEYMDQDLSDYLDGGLPPALTSLPRLECLVATGYLLTALPGGPCLDRQACGLCGLWGLLVRRFAANAVCRRHVCAAIAAARHTIMLSPLHACRLTRLDLRNNCFEHLPPALSPTCSSCRWVVTP